MHTVTFDLVCCVFEKAIFNLSKVHLDPDYSQSVRQHFV